MSGTGGTPYSSEKLKRIPKGKVKCTKCNTEKRARDFGWVARGNTGKLQLNTKICVSCRNTASRLVRSLKKENPYPKNSRCQCCNRISIKLCCDHSHKNGKFRGYICVDCNTAIGKLGDNIVGVKRALRYLQNSKK
jgi:hypothetical protein